MTRLICRLAVCLALAVLAGCAGQPAIPFDRATAGNVKTIGIVTPAFSEGPRIVLASSIGRSFGLIGALIDAGMETNRNTAFASLLSDRSFTAPQVFTQRLTAALQAQGYVVAIVPVVRDQRGFLVSYPAAADAPVDAYLDVVAPAYGYVAAGIGNSTPYRPIVVANCKLIRAADRSVLMQDAVVYNPVNPNGKYITIAPDPSYTFVDFDTLMGDPQRTVDGLDTALAQTATAIAALLR